MPSTSSARIPKPAVAPPPEIPTRIIIPSIKVDAPIVPVKLLYKKGDPAAQWQVPNGREAGWQNLTAKVGEVGNMVLNGHHNVNGRVFEHLKDLKPGDVITVYGRLRAVSYSITERHLLLERGQPLDVRLAHARFIQPAPDQRLTLVTCWPPKDYSHRLILIARPVGDRATDQTSDNVRN